MSHRRLLYIADESLRSSQCGDGCVHFFNVHASSRSSSAGVKCGRVQLVHAVDGAIIALFAIAVYRRPSHRAKLSVQPYRTVAAARVPQRALHIGERFAAAVSGTSLGSRNSRLQCAEVSDLAGASLRSDLASL